MRLTRGINIIRNHTNMKSFFKYVLATITGVVLLTILWFIVLVVAVSTLGKESEVTVLQNSVLHVTLNHEITERTIPNPLEGLDVPGFSSTASLGLDDIIHRLRAAATDDRIEGIYLDLSSVSASFATLQEIRDELLAFKEESGKFIVAYSDGYSQRAYFLASVADEVYLNPEGEMLFNGLVSQVVFFKRALEKLGIDMQVVKVGTYKSAVEPFILDGMSHENREQVQSFVGSIYDNFLADIAASRGIPQDTLFAIADEMRVETAQDAVNAKLVDALKYKDELLDELRTRLEMEGDRDIRTISLTKYKPAPTKSSSRDRVAVVYAVGDIIMGEGSDSQIGSDRISRELRRVRKDDRVKAVVLRVNSPGGSALASDVIWREVELTRQEKPIVVSMGDVAASGGYYIAAAADSIFAQANTITGSIGVFGLVPNMQGLMNDKLGISFDEVKTGEHADFLMSIDRPLTAEEQAILQRSVNRVYETFVKRVADGRGISPAQVDSIGQGRVWTGEQALQIGLVDRLASLDESIKAAAEMARLEDYRLVNYPSIKQPFENLFGSSAERLSTWFAKRELKEHFRIYEQVKSATSQSGIQARIPYTFEIY